jgi:hypothetical protein
LPSTDRVRLIVMHANRAKSLFLTLGLFVLASLLFVATRTIGWDPFPKKTRFAPVVIFVVMDTVRADHTSLCGYRRPTTPNLEGLVEDGASYACDSHSPSTWTLPSHATFFTGVEPNEHLAGGAGGSQKMKFGPVTPLGLNLPTLAEEMVSRGYQTLLLSGNPVVSERMGLTRGFDRVAIGRTYPAMHDHRLANRLKGLLREAWLDPSQPLFAFINIADPHSPWTAIPEGVGFLPTRSALDAQPGRRRYESGAMNDDEAAEYLSHLSDVYDFAVLRADRSLSLILEVFRSEGWLDEDYRLVITSDHGEYLGEHQMVEHGREFFYEPVTRVPFIYYSTEGRLDLPNDLPSIVAHSLARDGVLPAPLPQSFSSVFRKPVSRTDANLPCSSSRAALWEGSVKLVADNGRVTRFDLAADSEEMEPIPAEDHPAADKVLDHCRALDRAYAARPMMGAKVQDQVTAQLKALGYLGDDDEPPPPKPPEAP